MKNRFIVGIILFFILVGTFLYYLRHPLTAKVRIGNHVFPVELAVTQKEKEKGLGQRSSLAPGHGMLFVYDHKEVYPFWMKDMQFPLDFVWIAEKTVVDITKNVQAPKPGQPPAVIHPSAPMDKILELNAGDIQRFGTKIGDTVTFPDK
ncbi:DUF192 domain-containing protein [Patescibacteria group bacterium]|nr:DUF192 domain-containing protein [Patescibacteria group bacterium]MBU2460161.1 DUF192 domain-containing protein [Patescibacteria group bacterium]MBU2543930.1 DUF192 domain-containing protein [Patescibacteria group bacterium]